MHPAELPAANFSCSIPVKDGRKSDMQKSYRITRRFVYKCDRLGENQAVQRSHRPRQAPEQPLSLQAAIALCRAKSADRADA